MRNTLTKDVQRNGHMGVRPQWRRAQWEKATIQLSDRLPEGLSSGARGGLSTPLPKETQGKNKALEKRRDKKQPKNDEFRRPLGRKKNNGQLPA